jgi:hypothetical protein
LKLEWQVLQVGAPVDVPSGRFRRVHSAQDARNGTSAGHRAAQLGQLSMGLEPRDNAPDFTLPDQHGNQVSLSDLQGQTMLVAVDDSNSTRPMPMSRTRGAVPRAQISWTMAPGRHRPRGSEPAGARRTASFVWMGSRTGPPDPPD